MPILTPDGGPALALMRGLTVAFLLSISGTLAFRVIVLPPAQKQMTPEIIASIDNLLLRWLRLNLSLAALAAIAWFASITSDLAAPRTVLGWAVDAWSVITGTDFGRVLSLQLLAVVAACMVLGRASGSARWRFSFILGTAAVLLEVGHSHASAMARGVTYLEISEVLHLWAAAAWLGGLVPLLLVVTSTPRTVAATMARWFSPMGKLCVILLAVTASLQGWGLIGTLKALLHTSYGGVALLKLALFAVLLGYAILNRYWLAPALMGSNPTRARRWLIGSLALQTGFGLFVVLAAATLGELRPGIDFMMPE